jgi:putative phosphoesterase
MKIGVVSDTHGLLRPEVAPALAGVDRILHLGDVGKIEIIEALNRIAPVTAIRGNIDRTDHCSLLPATEVVELPGIAMYLLHNIEELDLDPGVAGFSAVLYGHSHKPSIEHRKGVLYFNPGSCGPRRFHLPVTVGLLHSSSGKILHSEIIELL